MKSNAEMAMSIRRTFGIGKACQIAFKNKKQYNRKDKSWKKED